MNIDLTKEVKQDDEFDKEYVLIYKDTENILDDINYENMDDRLICKSIINSIEKEASLQFKAEKCISIPHIGTLQKNKLKSAIIRQYKDFKEKRKTLSKEEYLEYTRSIAQREKDRITKEEVDKKNWLKYKKKFMKVYMTKFKDRGAVYANAWLYTHYMLQGIEFDPDIEDVYETFRY